MEWMRRIRMRALALVLGLTLVVIAMLSLTAWPAWPVVGVAVAAAAVVVNSLASKLRLENPVCVHCEQDLSEQIPGVYGVVCPKCGTIDASLAHGASDAPVLPDDDETDDETENAEAS